MYSHKQGLEATGLKTKTIVHKSAAPIYAAAVTWVLYALLFPLYQVGHFLLAAAASAVVALIASAGLEILRQVIWPGGVISLSKVDVIGLVMAVAAFIVLRWRKWNPILVMLLCGAARLGIGLIIG